MTIYRIQGDGPGGSYVADVDITVEGYVPPTGWPPPQDAEGWTILSTSPDSRVIYVDASQADDSGDGLSEVTAKKTLAAGYGLLRNGYPDHILLKRGETWSGEEVGAGAGFRVGGRSESEPMVIGAYGTGERPILHLNGGNYHQKSIWARGDISFLVITSIDMTTDSADPVEAHLSAQSGPQKILIEDVRAVGAKNEDFIIGGCGDVSIRRCVLGDVATPTDKASGLYAEAVSGLEIEGCVFDHNGWRTRDPAETEYKATIFNHNAYIQVDCEDVVVRDTIFARGSSHGLHLKSGGEVDNCLFLDNPIALAAVVYDSAQPTGIGTLKFTSNVISGSVDIRSDLARGWGIEAQNCESSEVTGNIVAHAGASTYQYAMLVKHDFHGNIGLDVQGNIVYGWPRVEVQGAVESLQFMSNDLQGGAIDILSVLDLGVYATSVFDTNRFYSTNPTPFASGGVGETFGEWAISSGDLGSTFAQATYPSPDSTIDDYGTSIEAFMSAARANRRGAWDTYYTAPEACDWFRSNFGVS